MSSPRISIVLPTYDRLEYLRETVGSVRAQTLTDWELIVVDDESTDGSVAWLESLNDPRVIVVSCAHSGNPARVRDVGCIPRLGRSVVARQAHDTARRAGEQSNASLELHRRELHRRKRRTGRA